MINQGQRPFSRARPPNQDQEKLPSALQFLPPTKTREPDPVLRQTHVETLLLLSTTHWGREHLRTHGVYEIVRALHEKEEVVDVSAIHSLDGGGSMCLSDI